MITMIRCDTQFSWDFYSQELLALFRSFSEDICQIFTRGISSLSCHGFIVVKGVRGEEVRDADVDEDDVAVGVQGALREEVLDSSRFIGQVGRESMGGKGTSSC